MGSFVNVRPIRNRINARQTSDMYDTPDLGQQQLRHAQIVAEQYQYVSPMGPVYCGEQSSLMLHHLYKSGLDKNAMRILVFTNVYRGNNHALIVYSTNRSLMRTLETYCRDQMDSFQVFCGSVFAVVSRYPTDEVVFIDPWSESNKVFDAHQHSSFKDGMRAHLIEAEVSSGRTTSTISSCPSTRCRILRILTRFHHLQIRLSLSDRIWRLGGK